MTRESDIILGAERLVALMRKFELTVAPISDKTALDILRILEINAGIDDAAFEELLTFAFRIGLEMLANSGTLDLSKVEDSRENSNLPAMIVDNTQGRKGMIMRINNLFIGIEKGGVKTSLIGSADGVEVRNPKWFIEYLESLDDIETFFRIPSMGKKHLFFYIWYYYILIKFLRIQ